MLSRNPATLDNNVNNPLQNNHIYVYKGGKIDEADGDNIENVSIDESVSVIGDTAFCSCEKLHTVQFSTEGRNLLKKIGIASFRGRNNLLSIDLKNTQLESIGNYAFSYCCKLATVQFPATIQKIGKYCFANCEQLEVVDLSHANKFETIEEGAFGSCDALTTVILSPTTSNIQRESFELCGALETVDLRSTCITEIGEGAFYLCKNLSSIHFPTTTRTIENKCFYSCKKLSSLDLQATNIDCIGDEAFQFCYALTTVNFPKTLTYIGKESFEYCTTLKHMNLHKTSVEKIGDRAFQYCTDLTTVVGISLIFQSGHLKLPASLLAVGEDAFHECPKLRNSINNNRIHFECDVNRGGRRFLQRDYRHQDNDGNTEKCHGKVYYSGLWPLILFRVIHEMELPKQTICPNDGNLSLYTSANPIQRQASVVFYLLIHGVIPDLQPREYGNVQTKTQKQKDQVPVVPL